MLIKIYMYYIFIFYPNRIISFSFAKCLFFWNIYNQQFLANNYYVSFYVCLLVTLMFHGKTIYILFYLYSEPIVLIFRMFQLAPIWSPLFVLIFRHCPRILKNILKVEVGDCGEFCKYINFVTVEFFAYFYLFIRDDILIFLMHFYLIYLFKHILIMYKTK